jgi:DNA-binding transcriptional LysR family regulator
MDLNEIVVFARVVQAGSFRAAALQLGMPKSTVSRKVAELEERLNARLLQRTTRKLSLTDVGRTFYEYSARIATEIETAERAVISLQATPQGLLRVTTPINLTYLGPIVADYLKRYPQVRLELFCTGRTVDLVEERFDLGIRAGTLSDSSLIARSLGQATWFLVATPAYLKRRGQPRSPEDLKAHDCFFFGAGRDSFELHLDRGDESAKLTVPARMIVSDMDVLSAAVSAGLGVGLLPGFSCVEALQARRLSRVLREWSTPTTPLHLVYPSTRQLSPKVKSFADHLVEKMTPPPWQLGPMS